MLSAQLTSMFLPFFIIHVPPSLIYLKAFRSTQSTAELMNPEQKCQRHIIYTHLSAAPDSGKSMDCCLSKTLRGGGAVGAACFLRPPLTRDGRRAAFLAAAVMTDQQCSYDRLTVQLWQINSAVMTDQQCGYDRSTVQLWQINSADMTDQQCSYDRSTVQLWQINSAVMTDQQCSYDRSTVQLWQINSAVMTDQQCSYDRSTVFGGLRGSFPWLSGRPEVMSVLRPCFTRDGCTAASLAAAVVAVLQS